MKQTQITKLIKAGHFPGDKQNVELLETHISWIILCRDLVYKIKKPMQFSFLDFSTLDKRKFFCEEELRLNQRLARHIYLDVLPVVQKGDQFFIGKQDGEIIDYCLQMKRMDTSREMTTLLQAGQVTQSHIRQIVEQLVPFHRKAVVVKNAVTPSGLIEDFDDILQVASFVEQHFGAAASRRLENITTSARKFIQYHSSRILKRDAAGLSRDCHGDLHSGNIFLEAEPVIFDCIEFNAHFRQIDILNELAFFCMDLEFYGEKELSNYFLEAYMELHPVMPLPEDALLLVYYKLYRANIKVKVNALKAQQSDDAGVFEKRCKLAKAYFELMVGYADLLFGLNGSV